MAGSFFALWRVRYHRRRFRPLNRSEEGSVRLQTLDRGLALLEWVAANPGNATVRQAAEALGVNMTTCYHLVDTLIARGYLVRTGYGHLGVGTLR